MLEKSTYGRGLDSEGIIEATKEGGVNPNHKKGVWGNAFPQRAVGHETDYYVAAVGVLFDHRPETFGTTPKKEPR